MTHGPIHVWVYLPHSIQIYRRTWSRNALADIYESIPRPKLSVASVHWMYTASVHWGTLDLNCKCTLGYTGGTPSYTDTVHWAPSVHYK